jgi:2-iminobutanoate/2-iminopropanoate deaminase
MGHGLPIEAQFGYAGALRVGNTIHVAGQLARDARGLQVSGPLATKLSVAYDNIASLLARFELAPDSVVQVQLHVESPLPECLDVVGQVSRQRLDLPNTSLTVIRVAGLNDADALVEISAVARPHAGQKGDSMTSAQRMRSHSLPGSLAARLGAADVVEHGDILYVSGQLPVDADGRLMFAGDIAGQFGAALDRVDSVLRAAGSSISRVLALDIFTSEALRPESFDAFCSAHRERMTEYRPTGTMVRVAQVPMEGALVYISAIAAR